MDCRTVDFDVQHRDCFDSLAAMRDAGGVRLIVTSPPYPDARTPGAYGGAEFDTSLDGYHRLGLAVFDALMAGGVCVLNLDGPVRVWRPELGESERSLVAFKVAIDWAESIGLRYVEHCARISEGRPGLFGPRWRGGWEPVHVFARPGAEPHFYPRGYTIPAIQAGKLKNPGARKPDGSMGSKDSYVQGDRRALSTAHIFDVNPGSSDLDHAAPFARGFADAYVLCYSQPGDIVGDPFVGSGTVAYSCHRHGRRFIGGDLGHREKHNCKPCGRRWADIVTDGLRQERLFPMEATA
jgi:hypothetical protein